MASGRRLFLRPSTDRKYKDLPMHTLRKSRDRGHADHGGPHIYHRFFFADYQNPQRVAFGALRVINKDRVVPGQGLGTHGQRESELQWVPR